jgi:hypothetical protein
MPMSYTRVLVIETPLSRAAFMKTVRNTEGIFKKLKKDKILNSYKTIEAGDRWLLIVDFDSKANLNKHVKATASGRQNISESGGQSWFYQGQVKASG